MFKATSTKLRGQSGRQVGRQTGSPSNQPVYYSLAKPTDVGLISYYRQTFTCIGYYQDVFQVYLGKYDKKSAFQTQ